MLIEVLMELKLDIEHVNLRTNKIMIDQSIETMQGFFCLKLKRKGILIDKEVTDIICSDMVEEKEEDYNCGRIIDHCDELKTSKEAEESPMIVETEPQIEIEPLKIILMIEDDLNES